jgi:hypothetical protein
MTTLEKLDDRDWKKVTVAEMWAQLVSPLDMQFGVFLGAAVLRAQERATV